MTELSYIYNKSGPHQFETRVATVALGSDGEQVVWKNNTGRSATLREAGIVPEASVTGNTTNTLILQLRNKGLLGVGVVALTALKPYITGTDLVAFKPDALVISTTAADLIILNGEVVALNKTEDGTGLALPISLVTITVVFD